MQKTFESWLPAFPGFYESHLYSSDEDYNTVGSVIKNLADCYYCKPPAELIEAYLADHPLKLDFAKFCEDVAKAYCEVVSDELTGALDSLVNIIFEEIRSPKYYNFETDAVYCRIAFDPDAALRYIAEHRAAFDEYIRETYTSRDGFFSWRSNDPADWLDPADWGTHEPGAILDFVIKNHMGDDTVYLLSARVREDICLADYYSTNPAFDEFLNSEAGEKFFAEYSRGIEQGEEYIRVMKHRRKWATRQVAGAKRKWLKTFVTEMADKIAAIDAGEEIA